MEELIYTVDRIEEKYAICEEKESKELVKIEIEKLPKGVKEGSLIKKIANIYLLDKGKEKTKEDSIKQKMDKLWKKRDNKGKN